MEPYRTLIGHHAGTRPDWAETFVSCYAAAHPGEDWAETFAHYLHIRETLDTAAAYGDHAGTPLPGARFHDLLRARPLRHTHR